MTVLDAYAVLAFLRDEPAAAAVADLLHDPTVLSAVNATEVVDQLVRIFGRDPDDVHADLVLLEYTGMHLAAVPTEVGLLAGRLRARHYHAQRMAVSLADCIAAATALTVARPLATSDPALAAMVRAEAGAVHGLPDSMGRVP
ncbi:MAG: PIN domain-containing protein [Geodermatophilaceae bacterium]